MVLYYPDEAQWHAAACFYSVAFGVPFDIDMYASEPHYAADLATGGILELRCGGPSDRPPSHVQMELVVGNPEAAGQQLVEGGFEVQSIAGATIATDPGGNLIALTRGPWPPPPRVGWAEVYGRLIETLIRVDPHLEVESVGVVDGEIRIEVKPSNATVAQVVRMYVVAAEEETGFTCEVCGNDLGDDAEPGTPPVLCADHAAEE